MKQSLDELFAVVYRYYARGMKEGDEGSTDTEEHRRLVQARIQAGAKGNPWRVLLRRLSDRLPEERLIQDGSLHLPTGGYDAGYVGWLWLPPRGWHEEAHQLGFLISFLVPCYVIYSAVNVIAPTTGSKPVDRYISFTFSPDEEPYLRLLTEEILSVFPGYEPMPPEIGNVIVPRGAPEPGSMRESSLFRCLFTDAW